MASAGGAADAGRGGAGWPGSSGFHAVVEWHCSQVVGNRPACPGAFSYSGRWHATHASPVPWKTGTSPVWQSKHFVFSCFPVSGQKSWCSPVGCHASGA